jgi:hypothetical protein
MKIKLYFLTALFCSFCSFSQTTTYDFTTNATLSFGAGGFGIWNTQADITIGGVAYRLTSGGNGSFTNVATGGVANSKCLRKDGSGGDSLTLQRVDGLPFQFYGIWVNQQGLNSYTQFYTLPPWYTLTAGSFTYQDMTPITAGTGPTNYTFSSTAITSGTGGVTVTSVQINFQAILYYAIDNIIVNNNPLTATTSKTNVLCNGGTTGIANVVASGGTTPYTYSWSPTGGTAATATGLAAGAYTCTITDAASVSIQKTVTITQPSAITLNANTQTNLSCNGGSNGAASVAAATGGAGGYTYNWTPGNPTGDGTTSVTGLTAGTYTVTVTDANSCTATRSFTITQPTAINTATGSQTNVSCNGGTNGSATVTPSGGTGTYTYSWSPSGGTAATASGLSAGTYTVTVTDANSCTATRSFTITQPTAINTATGSQTNVSCNGGTNGSATITPSGGTAPYTYSWSPSGGTAATASGRAAGTYTVTVTDANSCTATRSFIITQPTAISTATGSQTNVSCNGGTNGSATVTPSGGTAPYTYSWAPSGGTASTTTGRTAGTYTVTVTDANSCTATRSFTITQPTAINTATGSQTNVSCNGGTNGSATVTPSGGTAPYTYSWAPSGGTASTTTGRTAGTYTVTVTDANSCTATRSFTITQPTAINTATGSQTNVSCNGGTNGSATVTPSGGTAPYTYSWAPSGGTASTTTGRTAGTYTVTVTDANSCTATRSFTITQPTAINTATGSQTNVSCNGGTNGSATVTPSGGTAPYTYSWAPSGGTAATATNLSAGNYTVTVTDANSCTATRSFTITQPTAISNSSGSQTNVSCNGGTDGSIIVSPTGGVAPYFYTWSDGVCGPFGNCPSTRSNLSAGNYSCIITDANGCTTTQNFTITQPTAINSSVTQSLGVLTATQTDATYQWYQCPSTLLTGATNQSYTPTAAGDYKVDVTVSGCTVTSACATFTTLGTSSFDISATFKIYPNPATNLVNIDFQDVEDAAVTVSDINGRVLFTQKLNNTSNTINIDNLSSGMYLFKVNSDKGSATSKIVKN